MTGEQFHDWRKLLGLKQREVGALIGKTQKTVSDYEHGRRPVPKAVALACAAISLGLTDPYPDSD